MVPVADAVAVALPPASLHVFDAESGRRLDPVPGIAEARVEPGRRWPDPAEAR